MMESAMEVGKVEVTVKTMDSGQEKFEVDEEISVATFKESIAAKMNIPIERQRLIFQGKVLKDDKKLSDYGVANKVIHLVQKAPPTPTTGGSTGSASSPSGADATSSQFVVGTIPLLNPTSINPTSITQHIAQHIAGQIAAATGSSNTATVMATHETYVTPASTASSQLGGSTDDTSTTATNTAGPPEAHQLHSLLTQAHDLLVRCKECLDQFDHQSGADVQQLISSLSKDGQPMDVSVSTATDQKQPQAAMATGSSTSSTTATSSEVQSGFGAVLLADLYDDMATVNSRLATLQSQWATIVRQGVQLQEGQASLVNKLHTTIRTCQSHMTHVEVCTMRLTTQLTRPTPHIVELVDTSSALTRLLQPSSERQIQIGPVSIMSQTYSIPQALLQAHVTSSAAPSTSADADINEHLGGVISQVLDSMMGRSIGSNSDVPTPTTGISTSASGSASTTVTSATPQPVVSTSQPVVSTSQPVVSSSQPVVSTSQPVVSTSQPVVSTSQPVVSTSQPVISASQSVVSTSQPAVSTSQPVVSVSQPVVSTSQPVVSTSQPVVSETASKGSEGDEVHSKLPENTPTDESQPSDKNVETVPMVTDPPREDDAVVPAVEASAGEQRRPRLTIRLVHRPRGAPRSSVLDSDSDDDNTITINLNSDSDDEISDQPSGVETRDADGNLTTEYRAMLNTLQRRQERRERQLVNILQHRRREIQNREVTQRLAQLTESDSAATATASTTPPVAAVAAATGGGDDREESSDEEMDPQEALAAVRRLTRSLLPMMLGPQGQLTIHDLWMDIQANRGPDWVPPDQSSSIVSHLLEYVARGLTVAQLFEIFSGSAEPMHGLHPYLLEFVREKLLDNEIPTSDNKQRAINTLMERLQDYIDKIAEPVKVHPGINLRETINRCLQFSLGDVYDIIINKPEGDQAFGQALWGWCVNMAARIAAVTRHCMEGNEEEFQDVLRSFFTRTRDHGDEDESDEGMGVTPMSAFFTVSMVRRLNNFIEHCNFTQEDFDKFIVREDTANQEAGPSHTSPDEVVEVPSNDMLLQASSEPVAMDTAPAEQWPTNMPQEWIPVIQYDVEYMAADDDQSHDQQVPLSDAYMSGMPAKRRKVEKTTQSMPQVMQECLKSALTTTGAKPVTGTDVVEEVADCQLLCKALGEELYMHTRQRLQEDKNYEPGRYPNADRYYRPHN